MVLLSAIPHLLAKKLLKKPCLFVHPFLPDTIQKKNLAFSVLQQTVSYGAYCFEESKDGDRTSR